MQTSLFSFFLGWFLFCCLRFVVCLEAGEGDRFRCVLLRVLFPRPPSVSERVKYHQNVGNKLAVLTYHKSCIMLCLKPGFIM